MEGVVTVQEAVNRKVEMQKKWEDGLRSEDNEENGETI